MLTGLLESQSHSWRIEALLKTSGEDVPSSTMIRSSQQDLEEEETAFKMTPILEDLEDCRKPWPSYGWPMMTVRHIATSLGVSHPRLLPILTQELGRRKMSVRWVPRRLTDAQKHIEFSIWSNNLCWFEWDDYGQIRCSPLYVWNKVTVREIQTCWVAASMLIGWPYLINMEGHGIWTTVCFWTILCNLFVPAP